MVTVAVSDTDGCIDSGVGDGVVCGVGFIEEEGLGDGVGCCVGSGLGLGLGVGLLVGDAEGEALAEGLGSLVRVGD